MLHYFLRGGGLAVMIYIAILAKPGSSLFSFHPVLMTLAFTGAMTEAMFIFSKYGLASRSLRSTRLTAHWLLIMLAAIMHTIGFCVIYYNKEINSKPHFTSWHGTLGLIASIMFWCQLGVGIFAMYPKLLENFMQVKTIKANHARFGILIFICGLGTIILSLWSVWFATNASNLAFYGVLVFYFLLAITTILIFTKKYGPMV